MSWLMISARQIDSVVAHRSGGLVIKLDFSHEQLKSLFSGMLGVITDEEFDAWLAELGLSGPNLSDYEKAIALLTRVQSGELDDDTLLPDAIDTFLTEAAAKQASAKAQEPR